LNVHDALERVSFSKLTSSCIVEGTSEYGDISGMMGSSNSIDDGPLKCFNAAKSYQLRWFEDKSVSVNPAIASWTGVLHGLVDYNDAATDTVLIKINTATPLDYFISYNRKTGFNNETGEGDNHVLIVEQDNDGDFYSNSLLIGKLNTTQSSHQFGSLLYSSLPVTIGLLAIDSSSPPDFVGVTIKISCQSNDDCWQGNAACPASYCDVVTNTCERKQLGQVPGCYCFDGQCGGTSKGSVYLNCGGSQYLDSAGRLWKPDNQFVSGSGTPHSTTEPIENTSDDTLFQTNRFDRIQDPGEMIYSVPLDPGYYDIHLHWAEVYFNTPGRRVFDVLLEGSVVIPALDIIAVAGGRNIAYTKSFSSFLVPDGSLEISFNSIKENALVSASFQQYYL